MSSTQLDQQKVTPPSIQDEKKANGKVKKLRKKTNIENPMLKNAWLAGHLLTLSLGLLYTFYYFTFRSHHSKIAWLSYRFSLVGVIVSYLTSLLTQFNKKAIPGYMALLGAGNFQYMCLAVFWITNRSSFFKLLPFLLISLLQISSFYNVKPILKLENPIKLVIVYDEIYLFFLLLVDTLLLRGASGYGLLIYIMFYWLRILQNESTRSLVYSILIKLDPIIEKQAAKKPALGKAWERAKHFFTTPQSELDKIFQ